MSRDFDLWPFYPKINGLSGLMVRHGKLGDPSLICFEISHGKQTNTQTPLKTVPRDLSNNYHNKRIAAVSDVTRKATGREFQTTAVESAEVHSTSRSLLHVWITIHTVVTELFCTCKSKWECPVAHCYRLRQLCVTLLFTRREAMLRRVIGNSLIRLYATCSMVHFERSSRGRL